MEQNLNTVYKSVEIKSAVLGSKPCVQNTAIFQDIVQCSEVLWESPAQTQSFSYRHNHGDHCTSSQTTFLKQRQQQREKKNQDKFSNVETLSARITVCFGTGSY